MALPAKEKAASRLTIQDQVLALLKQGGAAGVTAPTLAEVTWRFGGSIHELKKKGWDIETKHVDGQEHAIYILHGVKAAPPKEHPDLLQRPAPATPSSGFDDRPTCLCFHPAAWHRNTHGSCSATGCTCRSYHTA